VTRVRRYRLAKILIFESGMTHSGVDRLRDALPHCEERNLGDDRRTDRREEDE
jgi:hypothetical protein